MKNKMRLISDVQLENLCRDAEMPFDWAKEQCPEAPDLDAIKAEIMVRKNIFQEQLDDMQTVRIGRAMGIRNQILVAMGEIDFVLSLMDMKGRD